ncbi:magnesium transporter [Mycobacterium sp. 3519A]|uniref:magnesium transporter MgtE N-terminal domain-containing protein n=1 Tax=Mycobacterium sp. 3519A TaxID=2057184 RepID=UPI000C7B692D|nr:magnesium transporter [Mycobacterium sp. 3519A]
MLLLSRLIGRTVLGPDGALVGRLADLTVGLRRGSGRVERILVRRRRTSDVLVPSTAVGSAQHDAIMLDDAPDRFTVQSLEDAFAVDEILLARDVLDTQVVDIAGQRLARVADVVLARTADGRLEVVGVEVGFGAVLRRLGLGRLATRARGDAVAWGELHLTSDRGRAVQLATPRSAVHLLDARGLALVISRLDTQSATEILATKAPDVAAQVVRVSHPVVAERVLRAMPDEAVAEIVAALPTEHATRWQHRLARAPALRGRRLLRSHVWPRRRHSPTRAAR